MNNIVVHSEQGEISLTQHYETPVHPPTAPNAPAAHTATPPVAGSNVVHTAVPVTTVPVVNLVSGDEAATAQTSAVSHTEAANTR
eukprot:2602225-Amphidinium_carterae.1